MAEADGFDSRNTSISSSGDTDICHDESVVSKASKRQKLLAKVSIRRDRNKQRVLKKRQENLLTMADFFSKQEEFKLWMFEQKGKNVNVMPIKEQREQFKKFVKLWNKRKLQQKYMSGPKTPPSRHGNRFSLIEDKLVNTPDLLDFREPVDLSANCTPASPMSTFGKNGDLNTPRRNVLSEINSTPMNAAAVSGDKATLSVLRKTMFDTMLIRSPVNKYDDQIKQNREAAIISGEARWKNLQFTGDGETASENLGELELQDLDSSPYHMMKQETEISPSEKKISNQLEILDRTHSPYSRRRLEPEGHEDQVSLGVGGSFTQDVIAEVDKSVIGTVDTDESDHTFVDSIIEYDGKELQSVGENLQEGLERDCDSVPVLKRKLKNGDVDNFGNTEGSSESEVSPDKKICMESTHEQGHIHSDMSNDLQVKWQNASADAVEVVDSQAVVNDGVCSDLGVTGEKIPIKGDANLGSDSNGCNGGTSDTMITQVREIGEAGNMICSAGESASNSPELYDDNKHEISNDVQENPENVEEIDLQQISNVDCGEHIFRTHAENEKFEECRTPEKRNSDSPTAEWIIQTPRSTLI